MNQYVTEAIKQVEKFFKEKTNIKTVPSDFTYSFFKTADTVTELRNGIRDAIKNSPNKYNLDKASQDKLTDLYATLNQIAANENMGRPLPGSSQPITPLGGSLLQPTTKPPTNPYDSSNTGVAFGTGATGMPQPSNTTPSYGLGGAFGATVPAGSTTPSAPNFTPQKEGGISWSPPSTDAGDSGDDGATPSPKPASIPGQGSPSYTAPAFRLVRGSGAPGDANTLWGNGNAVYVVNEAGERFHITEQAADDMRRNGTWSEPEVLDQSVVDSMALRFSITSASQLATINEPTSAGYRLVIGSGPEVYAVNESGERFHVTAEAAEGMRQRGLWREPVVVDQSAIDRMPMGGSFNSVEGLMTHTPAAQGVSDRHAQLVNEIFQQFVGREATQADIQLHGPALQSGKSYDVLASEIAASTEASDYRKKLIGDTFRQFVGREADAEDLRIHNEKLMSGEVTPEQFRIGIANAPEAVAYQNNTVTTIAAPALAMYTEAITTIYRQHTGRTPSEEEIRMHASALANGTINLDQLNGQVYDSPEARTFRGEVVQPSTDLSSAPSSIPVQQEAVATETPATQANHPSPVIITDWSGISRDISGYTAKEQEDIKAHIITGGGTWQEIDTIREIYASSDQQRIDAWEQFSRTGKYANTTPAPSVPVEQETTPPPPVIATPAPAAEPAPSVAASAPSAPARTIVTDVTGETYDITDLPTYKQSEIQTHINGGGTIAQLKTVQAIYDSGDTAAIENWEYMSKTGRYSPTSKWGQTYYKAISEGNTHEDSRAWANGFHANDPTATLPVPNIATSTGSNTGPLGM